MSWVGSTQLFLLIVLGLPAGRLLDLGYFRYAMPLGSILYTFSCVRASCTLFETIIVFKNSLFRLFMVSLVHQDKYYQIFLSQGLGMGIGAGVLFVPAMAVQAHHWRRRRPLAIGVVTAGISLLALFLPRHTDLALKVLQLGVSSFQLC